MWEVLTLNRDEHWEEKILHIKKSYVCTGLLILLGQLNQGDYDG